MAKKTLSRRSLETSSAVRGLSIERQVGQQEPSKDELNAQKLFKKGQSFLKRDKPREAASLILKGLKLDGEDIFGLKLLADALTKMGRNRFAIQTYEHALELAPDDMELHFGLGNLALAMDMNEVAAQFFGIYTQNCPDDPNGYTNLATAWRNLEKFDDVITLMQSVLPRFPDSSLLWNALAAAVYLRDDMEAAIPFYEEALRIAPDSAMTLSNLAKCMEYIGDFERAIELSKRALKADKTLKEPRMIMANCQIAAGYLVEGWKNYAVRFDPQRVGTTFYTHGKPEWRGEDISDKTILICPEQGIGDEIVFANTFGELIGQAGKCLIGCDPRLISLFSRSFPTADIGPYVDQWADAHRYRSIPFAQGENAPQVDYAIPAGELMKFFRPTTESFPERAGYLTPDPERVAFWKERLDALGPGPKVGIAWRSGKKNADRDRYHTSLDQWGPIFGNQDVHFVNLQYDDCAEELAAAHAQHGVYIHDWDDINLKDDLDDVAALMAALDLVISSGTAVGAMSLAVGTETWILWVTNGWSFGRQDRPALSVKSRCFSWPEGGAWPEVIDSVGSELKKFAAS